MAASDIDRITGKTFATHYACLLTEGGRYAATFDGRVRKLVSKSEHPTRPDMMRLVWEDTTAGKCEVVAMGKRYFSR
jgi:hypothetical protein